MEVKKLKLEDLTGEQRELADTIGIDAYNKLVQYAGGSSIYISDAKTMLRDMEIKSKFTGFNYRHLAREYGLSVRHIRRIVDHVHAVVPGQISLFDE